MKVKIGLGFGIWRFGIPTPEDVLGFAEKAEELRFDSIWLSDRLLGSSLEALSLLSALVVRTSRLKLGTSVLVAALRNPLLLAKAVKTIDYLSGGRIILGLGYGSDISELEACGIDTEETVARTDECIDLVKRLLNQRDVTYDGKFWQVKQLTLEPQYHRHRPLDVWVGGRSDAALRRVAKFGDGWMAPFASPEEYKRGVEKILHFAEKDGRKDEIESGIQVLSIVDTDADATTIEKAMARFRVGEKNILTPDMSHCEEVIRSYTDAGVDKFIVWPYCRPGLLTKHLQGLADILSTCGPEVDITSK